MSWRNKITMTLGIITMVVGLDTAVGRESEGSNHTACGGLPGNEHPLTRTKAPTVCPVCENADRASFVTVRDTPDGLKPVDASDQAEAKGAIADMKAKVVLGLHDAGEVSLKTLPGGSAYYLTPQAGTDAYALIVDLLRRHPEKVLLCQWVPASRASLYQIKLFGDTLVMVETARTESIKVVQVPVEAPNPAYASMLDTILDTLTTPYDPATYADQYAAKMRDLLASKDTVDVDGMKATKGKAATVAPVVDLMAALSAMAADQKKPARKRAERKSA